MASYIRIPIETNPELLAQQVFAYIQLQKPGWTPNPNNLATWIIRAVCQIAAQNRAIASDVQDDIYRHLGASLFGIPPLDATPATGTTTWTMIDSAGHTIPAGTVVGIRDSSNVLQPFRVVSDVVVPPGNSATAGGEVSISAVVPGSAANNIGTAAGNVELVTVLDYVVSPTGVVLVAATAGGRNDETDSVYLTRLVRRLQRLSQRPILPDDFSAMALDADPAVGRAVAIDGYNPAAGGSYNNEREISIAAVTSAGVAVSGGVKTAIDAYLQSNREITFIVHVIDPNSTTINITVSYHVAAGFVASAVDTAVTAALASYLSPANWGTDPAITDQSAAQTWIETDHVYYNEVITVISNVEGVDRVTALSLNGGGTGANVTLTTPAALTAMGTLGITHV